MKNKSSYLLMLSIFYFIIYISTLICQDVYDLLELYGIINKMPGDFPFRTGPYGGIRIIPIYADLFLECIAVAILVLLMAKRTKLLFIFFSILAVSAMVNAIAVTILRVKYHQPFYWVAGTLLLLIPLFFILAAKDSNSLTISWKFTAKDMLVTIVGAALFLGGVRFLHRL